MAGLVMHHVRKSKDSLTAGAANNVSAACTSSCIKKGENSHVIH
jgi:hypothetical protein